MDQEREAFEYWMSDKGAWPRAIEKTTDGNYKLMQAATNWNTWQAACKFKDEQKAEIEALEYSPMEYPSME
jgi:hypothetical protein